VHRHSAKPIPLAQEKHAKICSTYTNRIFQHGLKDRLKPAGRRADDAQHFRYGFFSLERLVALVRALSEPFLQIARECRRGLLSCYFALVFLDPPLSRSAIAPPHLPPRQKTMLKSMNT
jgi:hypothetical protein